MITKQPELSTPKTRCMETKNESLIFLVDDDQLYLRSLEHYLRQKLNSNAAIRMFRSGEELLKKLETQKPDLIIVDHMLNGEEPFAMDGLAVIQKVKQLYPDVRVVMLSGQSKMEVAIDSLKNGADDYVIKNDNAFLRIKSVVGNFFENRAKVKQQNKERYFAALMYVLFAVVVLSIAFRSLLF